MDIRGEQFYPPTPRMGDLESHLHGALRSAFVMVSSMSLKDEFNSSDIARYREIISDIDLSDAQKDEVIFVVQHIMQSFVDLAFQIDPTQLSIKMRGKLASQPKRVHVTLPHTQKIEIDRGGPMPGGSDSGI